MKKKRDERSVRVYASGTAISQWNQGGYGWVHQPDTIAVSTFTSSGTTRSPCSGATHAPSLSCSDMTQPPLHDVLFREGFSLPRVARQFLTRWLAPEFLALVDWSSLEIQRITGINTALAERKADLVYRVRAGGIRIWFYLLVEHQSTPDPHMPLRVLEYTVLIWQEHRRKLGAKNRLPLVVPVVLYPGPGRWSTPGRLRDLIEIPDTIRPWARDFAPDAGFLVVELSGLPLDQLANGPMARALLGALQTERTGNLNFEEVRTLVDTLFTDPEREQVLSIAQHLWTYLLHHSELKSPEIRQIVNSTIPETVRESFMSTAEMLRQEGRQEAILDALEIRFAHVPDGLRETIDAIHDESRLRSIHRAAIQAASLEDFARSL